MPLIILIVIVSSLILCTIFGVVDYFRATSGKKPIFIYHTINVQSFDVAIAEFEDTIFTRGYSATYYGIGYTVSICDSHTGKYIFQLGDKQKEPCYTSLTCTADKKGTLVLNDDSTVSYDGNDKDNYEYTFFEDKLTQVTATLIRPISSVENVETSSVKIKEFYDNIPGCVGMGKKISEETYETVIACTIPKMSSDDIDKYLPIRTKKLLEYTRDENIAYGMLIIIGLLTSIHCVSMCGAINLSASLNIKRSKSFKNAFFYNSGRVISYTVLGALVGFIGKVFSVNYVFKGAIILISSIIMLLMSLKMLGVIKIRPLPYLKLKNKSKSSFIIGLLNGLMPCGPLQSMQIYALSTGSAIKGAISMFLFGIGTVPLMLLTGIIFNLLTRKRRILLNKIASVLILILSLTMFNRALLVLKIDLFKPNNNYNDFKASTIIDNYQVVKIDLNYGNYKDIIVQKGIPVKMIISVESKYLTGCNEELEIPEFNIKKELIADENIIEFTPDKTGNYYYTCWMQMIKNNIKIIDDQEYFKKGEDK